MTSEECNQQVVEILASMVLNYLKDHQQTTEEKQDEKNIKEKDSIEAA